VIELDAALRDPSDPTRLLKVADSNDHLHLSDKSHKIIAEAVDLKLFMRQETGRQKVTE
jgi:lysophospholipase L1-like esterase